MNQALDPPFYVFSQGNSIKDTNFVLGIWGSAFTILLQQVVREGLKEPEEVVKDVETQGEVRKQMGTYVRRIVT